MFIGDVYTSQLFAEEPLFIHFLGFLIALRESLEISYFPTRCSVNLDCIITDVGPF